MKARRQIDAVLKYLYNKKDEARAIPIDTIKEDKGLLEITGNESELERMLLKLKEDKYLQMYPDYPRLPDGKQDISKGLLTYCSITFEGRLFWESGGYTKDLRRKKIIEFPQKFWLLIAIFSFSLGLFSDVFKEWLKQKISPKSDQAKKEVLISIDSSTNDKKHR